MVCPSFKRRLVSFNNRLNAFEFKWWLMEMICAQAAYSIGCVTRWIFQDVGRPVPFFSIESTHLWWWDAIMISSGREGGNRSQVRHLDPYRVRCIHTCPGDVGDTRQRVLEFNPSQSHTHTNLRWTTKRIKRRNVDRWPLLKPYQTEQ